MPIKDILQENNPLEEPEIRVWIHPVGESDYFKTFETIKEAEKYAKNTKRAEDEPLIAWKGYEWRVTEYETAKERENRGNISGIIKELLGR